MRRIGLISDTHGLLRPEAVDILRGCDLLLHAGDVGAPEVLAELARMAPVRAVRGNVDSGAWASGLPNELRIPVNGLVIFLHHGHLPLPDGVAHGADIEVRGHSHRPGISREGGRLVVNPGSAGPRRFSLPVTVAVLDLEGPRPEARLVDLQV